MMSFYLRKTVKAGPLRDVTGVTTLPLADASPSEFVSQVNETARHRSLLPLVVLLWLPVITIPLAFLLNARDKERRTVVVCYEVDGQPAERFQALTDAFAAVQQCAAHWHVTAEGAVTTTRQYKVNAGARTLVRRDRGRVDLSGPPVLASNIAVPSLHAKRRFKQVASANDPAMSVRKARAAALAGVYCAARTQTKCFPPEASFHAEQAVAVILATWQPLNQDSPIWLRARLSIDLIAADAAKAERFAETRRAARLEETLAEDHMAFLREVALTDEATARLWWLHRNLAGSEPATSWEVYNDFVRPLIAIGDPNDPITRLARTVLTLSGRLNENPQRLQILANIAELTLRASGMPDAADEVAAVVQSKPEVDGHE